MHNNVWAVLLDSWDGIVYYRLFASESSAKVHARAKNRECGIKDYYKVRKEEIHA